MNKKSQLIAIIKNYRMLIAAQKDISANVYSFCSNIEVGMNFIQEYCSSAFSSPEKKSPRQKRIPSQASFSELVNTFREHKKMTNVELYKKANVSKQVYSNIISGKVFPKRETVIAIAFALGLNFEETEKLLASAGHSFIPDDTFSRIVKECILLEKSIEETNDQLDKAGLSLLGNIVK